MDNNI